MTLSPEYAKFRDEIRAHAVGVGLDFFEVIFEMVDWKQMSVLAAYGGFPNRYPHWRFGMEYEHLSKTYAYGLTKIYEMVINNDPCTAYLLQANNPVDQKMVMAHVYAHSDFFKNNRAFASTNRRMIDEMGNHRAKIQRMVNRLGFDQVEETIDRFLSLENLVNPNEPQEHRSTGGVGDRPERDVLRYLVEKAPLEEWEAEILSILREEALYFAPQAQTKLMNEGWACFWHSKIMTEKVLTDGEVIDYADHHSGTVSSHPAKLNPYKIGSELFRDIEERWNRGRFGPEYEQCRDLREKLVWDRRTDLGRKKIFEVRSLCNDLTFLDTYLTEEFCREQKLYVYGFNSSTGAYEIIDRDFPKIKVKLLQMFTNMGHPIVAVVDGNYNGRGELLLKHLHEGIDLRLDWAWETLRNLHRIWKKTVSIETVLEGIPKLLSFDGEEQKEHRLT